MKTQVRYELINEYKTDIKSSRSLGIINEAKATFGHVFQHWHSLLDLACPDSLATVYDVLRKMGIFEQAAYVREYFFGKDIHFYGVCYLWDYCVERCAYCPASLDNRENAGYLPRMLSVEEVVGETLAIIREGHGHVCFLAGEDVRPQSLEFLKACLSEIDDLGLDEIILNVSPRGVDEMRQIRNSLRQTSAQFRVFQETYNRETYSEVHPQSRGRKHDYDFRYDAQKRAMDAGFDNYGIGALFGIHRFPLAEILGMQLHAEALYRWCGHPVARLCLPFVNQPKPIEVKINYPLDHGNYDVSGSLVDYGAFEMVAEIVYALTKLSQPTVSIVSSERDRPGLLKILDSYATCTTLNVRPGVGDNVLYRDKEQPMHFTQASVYPRKTLDCLKDYRCRGYCPILRDQTDTIVATSVTVA